MARNGQVGIGEGRMERRKRYGFCQQLRHLLHFPCLLDRGARQSKAGAAAMMPSNISGYCWAKTMPSSPPLEQPM
jgi:hypothetical protein